MDVFFTWRSSEHHRHLDVKWKPQNEIRGADRQSKHSGYSVNRHIDYSLS
jgi:hypothetical protein